MIRTRLALAAFLLTLALALPAAALPDRETARAWKGPLAALCQHLASVFGLSSTPAAPPAGEEPATSQDDGDSRSSMDPNG